MKVLALDGLPLYDLLQSCLLQQTEGKEALLKHRKTRNTLSNSLRFLMIEMQMF